MGQIYTFFLCFYSNSNLTVISNASITSTNKILALTAETILTQTQDEK